MAAAPERLIQTLRRHVFDERVLAAMAEVPRERFVPPELRRDAWENIPLPIGSGQTISQPLVVARMCELLELTGAETVLDVGTGSGYHAAVLARLVRHVHSIEVHESLSHLAAKSLRAAGVTNVTLAVGDGSRGLPAHAPYDAIVVAAAHPLVPPPLVAQLADGGRLVQPIGPSGAEDVTLFVRRDVDRLVRVRSIVGARFVPLYGRHGFAVSGEEPGDGG
jgi:protein-L-isoaspartate(D-aspartate) O-methyltransferase